MESRREYIKKKLNEFFKGNIPDYIVDAGKTHITIRVKDDIMYERDYVVTICSVHEYFTSEGEGDDLAGIKGDPQFVYNLALTCLRWFKFISPEEYR